jgi:tetratricopeptide (TPR) repeat protein
VFGFRKAILGTLVLLLGLFSCTDPNVWKKKASYYAQQCSSVDSIISFAQSQEPREFAPYLSQTFNRFHFSGDSAKADEMLNRLESMPTDPDSSWKYTAQMNRLFRAMWNQNSQEFYSLNRRYESMWSSKDTALIINLCNAAGSLQFAIGDLDSALNFFVKGLDLAERLQSDFDIMQLASNVGTIYYYKSMPGLASQYFSMAVEAMERADVPNPMLVNNVISALGEEGKYRESFDYYQSHKQILAKATDDQTRHTIVLNYAFVLSNLGRHAESQSQLDSLNFQSLSDHLKIDFINLSFRLMLEKGDWSAANEFLGIHDSFIWAHAPNSIVRLAPNLTWMSDSAHLEFNWERLRGASNTWVNSDDLDIHDKLELLNLLQSGPYSAAQKIAYAQEYKEFDYRYLQQSDSVRVSNIEAMVKMGQMQREQERIRDAMKDQRSQNQWLRVTAVLVTFLLFLLVVNLWQWRRDRLRIETELKLSLELEHERKAILEQERSYTDRIRVLSEALIAKSLRWSEMIKKSKMAKDPDAIQIRRELEAVASIKGNFEYDSTVLTRGESVEDALKPYPELDDLSHKAKEVVLLSISGQKPREISKLLDLNEQYIRNLKSTAKKRLEPRFGSKFRWEELAQK